MSKLTVSILFTAANFEDFTVVRPSFCCRSDTLFGSQRPESPDLVEHRLMPAVPPARKASRLPSIALGVASPTGEWGGEEKKMFYRSPPPYYQIHKPTVSGEGDLGAPLSS